MRDITVKLVEAQFGRVCEVRVGDAEKPLSTIAEPESLAGENYDEQMMTWIIESITKDGVKEFELTEEEKDLMEDKIQRFFQTLKPMSQRHKDQILRDMIGGVDAVAARTMARRAQENE